MLHQGPIPVWNHVTALIDWLPVPQTHRLGKSATTLTRANTGLADFQRKISLWTSIDGRRGWGQEETLFTILLGLTPRRGGLDMQRLTTTLHNSPPNNGYTNLRNRETASLGPVSAQLMTRSPPIIAQ
jgi:hypothetical protein